MSRGEALRALARGEFSGDQLLAWLTRWRSWLLIALGAYLRLAQYLRGRPAWLDELSLKNNIRVRTLAGFFEPLLHTQLVPPGFLAAECGASRVLGHQDMALRLFPFLAGILSLFLFLTVARRGLPPRSVWIAVALFAISDDLIYFSSEMKQYATDVAACLLCEVLGMVLATRPATSGRVLGFAAAGALVVWFSHPSAFVLGGVGSVLLVQSLRRRDWRRFARLAFASLTWLISFAGVYVVSLHQLANHSTMWAFWGFAFPPMPPRSLWDATWILRRWFYLFINPLDFGTPLAPRLSALPAAGFFVVGCVTMSKRVPEYFWMLVAPGLFTLATASLRLYPFHGRLVLFLVPALLLLIAEGVGRALDAASSRGMRALILGSVLLFPTIATCYYLLEPRRTGDANPRGDRRSRDLDPSRFPF